MGTVFALLAGFIIGLIIAENSVVIALEKHKCFGRREELSLGYLPNRYAARW